MGPHTFFASFSRTAEPIFTKFEWQLPRPCPQVVSKFGDHRSKTAEVDFLGPLSFFLWGPMGPHTFFASFSRTAEPIFTKFEWQLPRPCPQVVLKFGDHRSKTAEVDFLGPLSFFLWGPMGPHQFFASFSRTAEPIFTKFEWQLPRPCPQVVLKFGDHRSKTAEVDFLGPLSDFP